jgi:hypothetical protein
MGDKQRVIIPVLQPIVQIALKLHLDFNCWVNQVNIFKTLIAQMIIKKCSSC